MSVHVKKFRAALKHGAFSATAILPGEDPAALKELHQKLIAELTPVGALEDHIVWTIARLVWRKEHLATLRIGELVLEHESRIQAQKSQFELLEMEKYSAERREATMQAAEDQARKDLGANYELVEIGEVATVDRLLQDLAVNRGTSGRDDRQVSQALIVFERSKEFAASVLISAAATRSRDVAHSRPEESCVSISSSV